METGNGSDGWLDSFRALDRNIMRDELFRLDRGGLNDSVDVASARVRLLAAGIDNGWGSSFSISEAELSSSDPEEGDEHDDDWRSSSPFRTAIGAFAGTAETFSRRA